MAAISQTPAVLNLAFVAGDRFNFSVTLYEPLLDVNGDPVLDADGNPTPDETNPLDLTGAVVNAQIRRRVTDTDVLASFTNPNAVTLGSTGLIRVRLEEDESAKLRAVSSSVWDLQITWPDDRGVQTLLTGAVNATADVTR